MATRGHLGPPPAVGDHAKVFLRGESPWAECIAIHSDDEWSGRIVNRLVGEMTDDERAAVARALGMGDENALPSLHGYRSGMIVRFGRVTHEPDIEIWEPVEQPSGTA